jgi:hypothetical protein
MPETLASLEPAYYPVLQDPHTGASGFVLIEELIRERGTGGLRRTANVSPDEVTRRPSRNNLIRLKKLDSATLSDRAHSVMHDLSPKHLGFVFGSRVPGANREGRWNSVNKARYSSRVFG